MTAQELISQLETLPKDAEVMALAHGAGGPVMAPAVVKYVGDNELHLTPKETRIP